MLTIEDEDITYNWVKDFFGDYQKNPERAKIDSVTRGPIGTTPDMLANRIPSSKATFENHLRVAPSDLSSHLNLVNYTPSRQTNNLPPKYSGKSITIEE